MTRIFTRPAVCRDLHLFDVLDAKDVKKRVDKTKANRMPCARANCGVAIFNLPKPQKPTEKQHLFVIDNLLFP